MTKKLCFPIITEWAYSGWCFDLPGVLYPGLAVGDPVSDIIPAITGLS
jgi:hypothetical protein